MNRWWWIVSIRIFNTHACGGSLINNEWILTAAHCMTNTVAVTVHIGVHSETVSSPQIRTIAQTIIHPNYESPPRYVNDIALLRLSSPIDFTIPENYADRTCLPPRTVDLDYPIVDTQLAVIGWGRLVFNGIRPTVLRQVRMKTLANDERRCASSIINNYINHFLIISVPLIETLFDFESNLDRFVVLKIFIATSKLIQAFYNRES